MQKIVPHLWYDTEAIEAVQFYMSLFEDSRLLSQNTIHDTPSGDADFLSFELAGQEMMAINAGPYFKFNPSISLMVACRSTEEVDAKWQALSEGGKVLMELGEYPFSKRYGWIQDRYGLSWQLMLAEDQSPAQKITPCLLFSAESNGKTEEAVQFYAEVFNDTGIDLMNRYQPGEATSPKAVINFASFRLEGMAFAAMDNGFDVDFGFNEAFSLIVRCENQQEIDYYWDKLSAVPEAEQCGWLKDRFGVSWQITPTIMDEMFAKGTDEEVKRVTEAFLQMKKFDIAALEAAWKGESV